MVVVTTRMSGSSHPRLREQPSSDGWLCPQHSHTPTSPHAPYWGTRGRITEAVIEKVAYIAQIGEHLFGSGGTDDKLFEVAVIHHTQCGSGFLAEPGFRHQFAARTGRHETELEALAVTDPHATIRVDVERLLSSPMLSPKVSVSGHVYDIATGRLTTAIEARNP